MIGRIFVWERLDGDVCCLSTVKPMDAIGLP